MSVTYQRLSLDAGSVHKACVTHVEVCYRTVLELQWLGRYNNDVCVIRWLA